MSKLFNKVIAGNKKQQEKNDAMIKQQQEDDLQKHIPIAKKVLQIIIDADLPMGNLDVTNSRPEAFAECSRKIMELFLEENIDWMAKEFVFQLAMQPLTFIQRIVTLDLTRSFNLAQAAVFGCDDMNFVTMKMIDETWKAYDMKKKNTSSDEQETVTEEPQQAEQSVETSTESSITPPSEEASA